MHWCLWKKYHLECNDKWYTERERERLTHTHHNHSRKMANIKPFDSLNIDKQKRECPINDFAIPGDQNITIKEQEKIDKYQDLRIELQEIRNVKVVVMPVVIGALGTMLKRIHQYIKQDDIPLDTTAKIGNGAI